MDKYIEMMKDYAVKRGSQCGKNMLKDFVSTWGQGYPQDNRLKAEFAAFVKDGH
ncbi:MAG: hypothetical protein LLF92_02590 [Planctomycetaceae bacterium]|nr:hypothetical protein [Planctomycetaceae bacterium]